MAVRFTRVFGLYTFFSVFLPGMMFLLGVAPLAAVVYAGVTHSSLVTALAANRLVTLFGALVFVTLGLFVGFGLHSLGAWFEKKFGDVSLPLKLLGVEHVFGYNLDRLTIRVGNRHRDLFYEMLNGRHDAAHAKLVSSFVEVVDEQFPRLGLDLETPQRSSGDDETEPESEADDRTNPESNVDDAGADGTTNEFEEDGERDDRISEREADAIYTLVRSQIHIDQSGRSRTFQAVFASCRSMLVAWALLTCAYFLLVSGMSLIEMDVTAERLPIPDVLQGVVSALWVIDTEPAPQDLNAAFLLIVAIGFGGMYGFASVARNSKQYYLEYLVSDYLLLHRESGDESDGGSEQLTTRP